MQSLMCSFHIDKATNPLNKDTDWDIIKGFCDQLNNDPEGWDDDDEDVDDEDITPE